MHRTHIALDFRIIAASCNRNRTRNAAEEWTDAEPTGWDAEAWTDVAENSAESLHKGDSVILSGTIHTWTGQDHR